MQYDENARECGSPTRSASRGASSRIGSAGRPSFRLISGIGLALGLLVAAAQVRDLPGSLDETRSAMAQYVELRKSIAQAKSTWEVDRELLSDRTDFVQRQIEAVRERIAKLEEDVATTEAEKADSTTVRDGLAAAQDYLGRALSGLETKVAAVLGRLPTPLTNDLSELTDELRTAPESSTRTLSERYLTVLGILTRAGKFNRQVSTTSELRALSNGAKVEVTTLYVGLGGAYYASSDGAVAGWGSPGPDAWIWTEANASAPEILAAIAVFRGDQPPHFVLLPFSTR